MSLLHRIRTKLAFAFVAVALVPATIIGSYSVNVSNQTLLEKEHRAQLDEVSRLKSQLESFLASARGDVLFLSQSEPLKNLVSLKYQGATGTDYERAKKAAQNEFLAFSNQRKIYYQVRYLDETGQELVRVDFKDGKASVRAEERLQNKGNRYYFTDAVKLPEGQVFVSPLDLNREKGQIEVPHKPVIRYAVPLKYEDGSKAGVVLTNVDAKQFLSTLKKTMLVDEEGFYLAHQDQAKTWGSPRDLDTSQSFKQDYASIIDEVVGTSGTIQTAMQAISFQEMTIPGTFRNWKIISSRNLDDLLLNIRSFQKTFWSILVGSLIAAIIFALFLDRKISRPIEQLTEEANKVSMGDLNNPVISSDKSEIGQLAQAFERMRISMVKAIERSRRSRG